MRTLCVSAVIFFSCKEDRPAPILRVACAADAQRALQALSRPLPGPPTIVMGSSGILAKQLAEGAPFDVFASADEALVNRLVADGHCDGSTKRRYARGRVALVSAPTENVVTITDLVGKKRIAIANPALAPYGRAAKEVLEKAGLWAQLEPQVVLFDNVQQAMNAVERSDCEAGLVAMSVAPKGTTPLEPSLHSPIHQAIVACAKQEPNRAASQAFIDSVMGEAGQAILQGFGFESPR
jgi:molybdate transport system substrate-binding protein